MVFEQIDRLKSEYTDKYVVVDGTRPELRRFKGQTGIVRSVNMSGRALVEFDAHENIGWYDIELDFLTVIDQPLSKPEKPAAKPAHVAAKPAAKAAVAKKPGAGLNVEAMLAAARGEKGGGAPAKTAPAKAKTASPAAAPAKAAPGKMSVEEMLAAARAEKAASADSPDTGPASEPPAESPAAAPVQESSTTEATPRGDLPTATADIVDYCRKIDGG